MWRSLNCIAFFDSDCITCNKFINFLLKIDKKEKVRFSKINGNLYKKLGINDEKKDTIIYLKNNRNYYYTDAITEILKDTHSLFMILNLQYILPQLLRDFIYKIITKKRKKSKNCSILVNSPHKNRFV